MHIPFGNAQSPMQEKKQQQHIQLCFLECVGLGDDE